MENPHHLPPELARAMGERLAGVAINRYPDPTAPELKRLLRLAMGIPASLGVVLGNGSDELIQMLSLALARPGAVALAAEPSFVMYRVSAIVAGMRFEGCSRRSTGTSLRSPGSPTRTIPPATCSLATRCAASSRQPRGWSSSTRPTTPTRAAPR
jgi:histidinol-phosphate aminotransferase